MSSDERLLSYGLAINEAIHQAMEDDPSVIVLGQGLKSPWYVGATATGLLDRFGPSRVLDTPVSENAVTGAAVGAALAGLRPLVVHPRMDFMLYAFDPIVNQAANWHYMSGGISAVPVVFWGIINRRGEQAAQHSQALHSMLAHVPGLKVVAPASPRDAKGLMLAALADDNPVVFIDDRSLYALEGPVPEQQYRTPIGSARIVRSGRDISIFACSELVPMAVEAADLAATAGCSAEVVDLRSLKPLDRELILESAARTGRVLVCDPGWTTGGIGAEILAAVAEAGIDLRSPPRRVGLPDCPAPAARSLEAVYYPSPERLRDAVLEVARASLELSTWVLP